MKQPYENVFIGNFIFALGYRAAVKGKGLSDKCVHLVQQTPDDTKLNDLFVNWSGKNYIFEFKRDINKIKTELVKPSKKKLNIALNERRNEQILVLSNKSHFMGFGLKDNIGFITYSSIHSEIERYIKLHDLFEAMLDSNNFGLTYAELQKYLSFIESVTDDDSGGCGGFILNITGDGRLNMVPFDNVNVLASSLDPQPPSPPSNTPRP